MLDNIGGFGGPGRYGAGAGYDQQQFTRMFGLSDRPPLWRALEQLLKNGNFAYLKIARDRAKVPIFRIKSGYLRNGSPEGVLQFFKTERGKGVATPKSKHRLLITRQVETRDFTREGIPP